MGPFFFFLSSLATLTLAIGGRTARSRSLSRPAQGPSRGSPLTTAAREGQARDRSRHGSPRRWRPSGATPAPARSAPRGGGRRVGSLKARGGASEAPPSVPPRRARRRRARD